MWEMLHRRLRPSRRLCVPAGRLFLLLLLLQQALRRALGLLVVGGQAVVDVFQQAFDPRGIGAEVVAAEARRRTHVDAGAIVFAPDPHSDIVAEPHDGGARHRLDHAVAPGRERRGGGPPSALFPRPPPPRPPPRGPSWPRSTPPRRRA